MGSLLIRFPAWVLCAFFVFIVMGLSGALLMFIRRSMKPDILDGYKDAAAVLFGTASLIYSLVFAFVIVAVWGDYEDLNSCVLHEAAKLSDMRSKAEELPAPLATIITTAIKAYASREVQTEWNTLSDKPVANTIMHNLQHELYHVDSMKGVNTEVVTAIKDDISDVLELRSDRTGSVHSHVPLLVWVVLVVGSIIVVVFSYFFLMPAKLHYLFTSLLTGMIAMCIFLLFMLDNPLVGTSSISPEPLLELTR